MSTSINPYIPTHTQTQAIFTGLSGMQDYYTMESNEVARKTERLSILGYVKWGLFVLYGIVYFVLVLVLFLKASALSLRTKFLIVVVFALYPFFIYTVENAAVQMYYYIYSVIYGYSYHEVIARKGLQNAKKFQQAANLSRNVTAT